MLRRFLLAVIVGLSLARSAVSASARVAGTVIPHGKRSLIVRSLLAPVIALLALALPPPPASAAAGDLDPSFGTTGKVTTDFSDQNDFAESIAIQPDDNKIVVAGCDYSLGCIPSRGGGGTNFQIARYNVNGSLDTAFDGDGKVVTEFEGGGDGAADVAIRSDGKIVAVGVASACSVGCGSGLAVARYEADGNPDLAFGTAGKVVTSPFAFGLAYAEGHAVTLHEGKTIVAGAACNNLPYVSTDGCDYDFVVARYRDDGLLDTSFGSDGVITLAFGPEDDQANAVYAYPDGKILVGGFSSNWDFVLARLKLDGTLDETFGGGDGKVTTDFGGAEELTDLAIQQGQIVAVGRKIVRSVGDFALARYNPDGSLDTSFGRTGMVTTDLAGDDSASSVALDSLDRIVVAGQTCSTSTSNCVSDFAIVRYGTDGALDRTFASSGKVTTDFGGNDRASDVAIQGDDKIVAAGTDGFLTHIGADNDSDFAVARYLTEGTSTTDTTSPEAPRLLSPPDTATINDNTPVFDWSDVTDPSGVSYQLQADNNGAAFESPELDLSGLSASSVTPSAALTDGKYHWRARAADGAGNVGSWSATFSLTIDTTPPTAPSNLLATAGRRKISLSWSASSDSAGTATYDIYRGTSASGPFAKVGSTTNLGYTDSGLKAGRTYWYHAKAVDKAGNHSVASNTVSATAL